MKNNWFARWYKNHPWHMPFICVMCIFAADIGLAAVTMAYTKGALTQMGAASAVVVIFTTVSLMTFLKSIIK